MPGRTSIPAGLRRSVLAVLLLAVLLPLGWRLFGPRGVSVEVQRKTWRFEIEVERLVEESGSAWCDELPADAREIGRRLIEDPSGRRPEASEHCRYSSPQWRRWRIAQAQGTAAEPAHWPQPQLNAVPAGSIGAERPGERRSFYEIELQAADGRHWTCRLPPSRWQLLRPGARFRLQVNRQGVADCASLQRL